MLVSGTGLFFFGSRIHIRVSCTNKLHSFTKVELTDSAPVQAVWLIMSVVGTEKLEFLPLYFAERVMEQRHVFPKTYLLVKLLLKESIIEGSVFDMPITILFCTVCRM